MKWRKVNWRANENAQGMDVQAASEIDVFTGTWLPLLQIPFSTDHSVDIKKNSFSGARTLVRPNLVHKQPQKSMLKMALLLKGPIAYLVF